MFFVKSAKLLFTSNNKINRTFPKLLVMIRKKCGCKKDNEHNLNSVNSVSSQMGYRYDILTTPVKSSSDKKDYKLFSFLCAKKT